MSTLDEMRDALLRDLCPDKTPCIGHRIYVEQYETAAQQEARAGLVDRVAALEALLARAIESLHDAERELHVWVDRDRVRHPGWPDVGYEPWNNKPSLALWSVEVSEIERDARALAQPPAPVSAVEG